jgi:hypothetical protein
MIDVYLVLCLAVPVVLFGSAVFYDARRRSRNRDKRASGAVAP